MAEEKPVNDLPKESSGEKPLVVRRGRVGSVDLYEIKDNELDLLERGSPADLYLNFAIFLLSIAFSALAALCTTTAFKYPIIESIFVVVMVVGFLAGVLLLILWWNGRKDVKLVVKAIRARIPPDTGSPAPSAETAEVLPPKPT